MAAKEGQEGGLQDTFDKKDQSKAARQLDSLPPPRRAVGEMEHFFIHCTDNQHTAYSTGHRVSVFYSRSKIWPIHPGRECVKLYKSHKCQTECQHCSQDSVKTLREPQCTFNERIQNEHQQSSQQEGHTHIRRCMYPQIQPGYGY